MTRKEFTSKLGFVYTYRQRQLFCLIRKRVQCSSMALFAHNFKKMPLTKMATSLGRINEASKARLDIPSPSHFIIVPMVMDHLRQRRDAQKAFIQIKMEFLCVQFRKKIDKKSKVHSNCGNIKPFSSLSVNMKSCTPPPKNIPSRGLLLHSAHTCPDKVQTSLLSVSHSWRTLQTQLQGL